MGKSGFGPCQIGGQLFQTEFKLVVIEAFGPAAKLVALQLADDQLKTFDLGPCLGKIVSLDRQAPHHKVQRLNIIRQLHKIDVHGRVA